MRQRRRRRQPDVLAWPRFPSRPSTGLRALISFPKSWPPSGLLLVIFALARTGRGHLAAAAVGAYIGAAYFFTSSTSFANPAITVGRMFSNTFAGIAPSSAPSFIGAQVVGGVVAVGAIKALYPKHQPGRKRPKSSSRTPRSTGSRQAERRSVRPKARPNPA